MRGTFVQNVLKILPRDGGQPFLADRRADPCFGDAFALTIIGSARGDLDVFQPFVEQAITAPRRAGNGGEEPLIRLSVAFGLPGTAGRRADEGLAFAGIVGHIDLPTL